MGDVDRISPTASTPKEFFLALILGRICVVYVRVSAVIPCNGIALQLSLNLDLWPEVVRCVEQTAPLSMCPQTH